MTLYLDCNASNAVDPRVLDAMIEVYRTGYGNAGSPHAFGQAAKDRVQQARAQVAAVVNARRHEVFFTSGATESNNLAILGLETFGCQNNKRHIISTQIEHHAVLEPLQQLERRGFRITWIAPDSSGSVSAEEVLRSVCPDTLLISVMHVNNETGVVQPIQEIAAGLQRDFSAQTLWLHVDAAQGFGKDLEPLQHARIDMISVSGHKILGPQGIGALIVRRRDGKLPPLRPLAYGGGQELGLRPGTLPVALIVGLGLAAQLSVEENLAREEVNRHLKRQVVEQLKPLGVSQHGDPEHCLSHVLNFAVPGWDSERLIEAWWDMLAVSDGAACTSVCATASHVLTAMGLPHESVDGAIRMSWGPLTDPQELRSAVGKAVARLLDQSEKP